MRDSTRTRDTSSGCGSTIKSDAFSNFAVVEIVAARVSVDRAIRINGSAVCGASLAGRGVTVRFRSCARCRIEATDSEAIKMLAAANIDIVWFLRRIIGTFPNGEGTGQAAQSYYRMSAWRGSIFGAELPR